MKNNLKPAISPTHISLPDNLRNLTLNDLLNDDDTEVIKKGNKMKFKRASEYGTATLEIENYETGRSTITQSTVPAYPRKSDYIDDIIEMKRSGMKQKDIAFRLGISESYVTKLLKDAGY